MINQIKAPIGDTFNTVGQNINSKLESLNFGKSEEVEETPIFPT